MVIAAEHDMTSGRNPTGTTSVKKRGVNIVVTISL